MGRESDRISICTVLADGFPTAIAWVDSQESSRPLDTVQHVANADEESSVDEILLSNLFPVPSGHISGIQSTVTLSGVEFTLQACCGRGPMPSTGLADLLPGARHRLNIRQGTQEGQSAKNR